MRLNAEGYFHHDVVLGSTKVRVRARVRDEG